MKKQRIIALCPAYNAQHTLLSFLSSIPSGVFDAIILVDDSSTDETYALAKKQKGIMVYKTAHNLGYGGNVKYCLSLACQKGADIIIELHPDGEYGMDGIRPAIAEVQKGALFVLGNRFSNYYPKGMYWWKYIVSRCLSAFDSLVLGVTIPDMHQGFRVYTRELLSSVNWQANHDDYLFSFEIIAQAAFFHLPIASVPVTAQYRGAKRGAKTLASVRYTLKTFVVLGEYIIARMGGWSMRFAKPPAICQ
jgi:glycosyltransferase involved in cell wall biosynthesis